MGRLEGPAGLPAALVVCPVLACAPAPGVLLSLSQVARPGRQQEGIVHPSKRVHTPLFAPLQFGGEGLRGGEESGEKMERADEKKTPGEGTCLPAPGGADRRLLEYSMTEPTSGRTAGGGGTPSGNWNMDWHPSTGTARKKTTRQPARPSPPATHTVTHPHTHTNTHTCTHTYTHIHPPTHHSQTTTTTTSIPPPGAPGKADTAQHEASKSYLHRRP